VVNDPQTGIEHKLGCEMEVVGSRTHKRANTAPKVAPLPVEATVPEGQVYPLT
jgi:hypothetical protein